MTDIVFNALPTQDKTLIILSPNQISDSFARLVKKTCDRSFSFHALRHYNASVMLQLNIPDKYAMERMGHSTNNMLKRVYQHTFEDETMRAADKLDDFFDGVLVSDNEHDK